jgi:hypothetical protein
MTMHVLEADDPRLAKYRAVAAKIGDTPEEFSAWVDRLFEQEGALKDRGDALRAREAAVVERENAATAREKLIAERLADMRTRLDQLIGAG